MAMDQEKERVRYYVEVMTATMERTIRRLWVLCIILVALLLATNAGWLWYESQYEDVVITADQTASDTGVNYAVGGDLIGNASESNH